MKCPNDSALLVMSERSGVEIDYCPECRGVWLDRGELDKIIDRAESEVAGRPAAAPAPQLPNIPFINPRSDDRGYGDRDRDRDRGYGDRHDGRDNYRPKKRESWLGDIFG
jgi:Zn-finger nucleic acid-binding protein